MLKYVKAYLEYFPYLSTFATCFLGGAAVEFTMINWTAGQTNFYSTYRQNQVVHNFFKPLEGLEESIEKEYQALREKFPPPTIEERVARFDEMHKKLEEYEQNKKPWKLPEWLTWKK
ncbi:hypothetical protein V9T40_007872 [Parthenolecanium corni]|uniref:Uncharacterized protein n=1 Tax=Parthenolecanium corni TaxID=536013 RepID=A0AAN9TW44_9HEMI